MPTNSADVGMSMSMVALASPPSFRNVRTYRNGSPSTSGSPSGASVVPLSPAACAAHGTKMRNPVEAATMRRTITAAARTSA
jgi:hypothetical protein